MIDCTAAVRIAVSFLWAIYTAAIAPSTVRRANSQMNINCTAAMHIAFAQAPEKYVCYAPANTFILLFYVEECQLDWTW